MSIDELLKRFAAQYGEPETTDIKLFLDGYRTALRSIPPDVLEKAYVDVLRAHAFKGWPRPGDIYTACRPYFRVSAAEQAMRKRRDEQRENPRPSAEAIAAADARVRAMMTEWRQNMAQIELDENAKRPVLPPLDFTDVQRPAFEHMQRTSQNQGLHRVDAALSAVTKRITGEHQE